MLLPLLCKKSVYSIGQNLNGEFGLNHKNPVKQLTSYNKQHITNVHCGHGFNIYGDDQQNYWAAGHNAYGSCSVGYFKRCLKKLKKIKYFRRNYIEINQIFTSISSYSCFWLTKQNQLYAVGDNDKYQLGVNVISNSNPVLINNLPPFTDIEISPSFSYTIALFKVNINKIIIFWFKINKIMLIKELIEIIKLFYGNQNTVYTTEDKYACGKFKLIETLRDVCIIKISTGFNYSLFLESNGNVWCCGNNHAGQLGMNDTTDRIIPTKIQYFLQNKIKIRDISCGQEHNLAIDYNNAVYSWGYNHNGECGVNKRFKRNHIIIPTLIDTLQHIKINKIKCGRFHSYVSSFNNKHYLFGQNVYNECIPKNAFDQNKIKILQPCFINAYINEQCNGKSIKDVYLGVRSTIFILIDKRGKLHEKQNAKQSKY